MCGISGIISNENLDHHKLISIMIGAMSHRGPDSKNFHLGPDYSIGHNRLSIIDLNSRSNQPFYDNENRYIMSYNGEIYNYIDLKNKMKNNYTFKTNSDTEVLLAGYKIYGKRILSMLNGCFAFAIYDTKKRTLFFARDRLGIKPLYYAFLNGVFIFCSEIKPILETGLISRNINHLGINQYLSLQSSYCPNTTLNDVKMLEPGSFGILKHYNLKYKTKKYWEMKINNDYDSNINNKVIINNVRDKVLKAIELRQVSDVKVGAFLSGGVDSSIIVAGMKYLGVKDINTFSLVHKQSNYDESKYSDLIAKSNSTNHHRINISKSEVLHSIKEAVSKYDSPSIDGINSYIVSKKIKDTGIRVALSGLGGDEVFAGYPQFHYWYFINKYCKSFPRRYFSKIFNLFFKSQIHKSLAFYKFSRILGESNSSSNVNSIFRNITYPAINQVFKHPENFYENGKTQLNNVGLSDYSLSAYSISELNGYTSNVLLKDTDQMSMANSLEVRVPFLDHNLLEYMLNIKNSYKKTQVTKGLLINAFKDLIPSEIYNRKKQGFTIPIKKWMKNELYEFCEYNLQYVMDSDSFNGENIKKMWDEYIYSEKNYMNVWSLVVLSSWLRRNKINF